MFIEGVTEVCRLCLKSENLGSVFDLQFENESMTNVIFITTGVEILIRDLVTHKVCWKCVQISKKMFQFRLTSLNNDKFLKRKYNELTKNGIRVPNTSITIRSDGPSQLGPSHAPNVKSIIIPDVIHASVKYVFNKYPNIRLPNKCLNMDIAPCVTLPMNEVENYFKKHNRCLKKSIACALQALRPGNNSACSTKSTGVAETSASQALATSIAGTSKTDSNKSLKNTTISPINIKLLDSDKTEYKIIRKDNNSIKETIKSDLKRKFPSRDNTPDRSSPSTSKKRRISESSNNSDKTVITKSTLIESLGLTPTETKAKIDADGPVQISVQKTIEICNICNSIHNNIKDLKKHKLKHLRCQFCKAKFKSMMLKDEHIANQCITKKTMSCLPDVKLVKIEYNSKIRLKYPKAFSNFPPLTKSVVKEPAQSSIVKDTKQCLQEDATQNDEKAKTSSNTDKVIQNNKNNDASDIIEILSDDEASIDESSKSSLTGTDTGITSNSSISDKLDPITINTPGSSVPSTSTAVPQSQLGQFNLPSNISSSIVKPDIRIKNNYILDAIDPKATDLMVMTELLKNYRKVQLTRDIGTQPELPANTSIKTNLHDNTTTLKDLKHQLLIYRIPVEVKHGAYKVTYNYTQKQKKPKKMNTWSHLPIIDLKPPKNKVQIPRYSKPSSSSVAKPNLSNRTEVPSGPSSTMGGKPSQDIPSHPPPPYNDTLRLSSINHSINPIKNNPQNGLQQTSAPIPLPHAMSVQVPSNTIGNLDNRVMNTTPIGNTVGFTFNPNNAVLVPQTSTLSAQAQILYQTTPSSSVIVNPSNSFLSYSNNSVSNLNASVLIPNSIPQVLVSSTPVFTSNPLLTDNSGSTVPLLSATSNILSTTIVPSSTSNMLSSTIVPSASSTTSVIPSFSLGTPLPSSIPNSSTTVQPTECVVNATTISAPTVATPNLTKDSSNIALNNNQFDQSSIVMTYLNVDNSQASTSLPVTTTQGSASSMPVIRVKNLMDLT